MNTENQQTPQQDWVRESAFGSWFLDTVTWSEHVLKIALDQLESLMSPRSNHYPTVLDVGFGFGQSLVKLDQRFRPEKIIGLDVDPRTLEWAEDKVNDCNSDVQLLINNAASIDVPDNSVDLILCHQTLHHIADQASAVNEFYRVLKPGGVLLLAESCRKFIHSLPIKVLFRHPMDVQKTDAEYLQLLKDAGFHMRPENISRPYTWWSRLDLGLMERIGKKPPEDREETLINVAAYRPE